jgi:hypothetical protein
MMNCSSNVVDEPERLKDFQRMRCSAEPKRIEANWPRTCRSLDALDNSLLDRHHTPASYRESLRKTLDLHS